MEEEVNKFLSELKDGGIESAFIRKDGVKIHSTITLDENTSNLIVSLSNTVEAIMKKVKDKNNEMEVSTEKGYFIVIPIGDFYLCGITEDREKKKMLREYAKKIAEII